MVQAKKNRWMVLFRKVAVWDEEEIDVVNGKNSQEYQK